MEGGIEFGQDNILVVAIVIGGVVVPIQSFATAMGIAAATDIGIIVCIGIGHTAPAIGLDSEHNVATGKSSRHILKTIGVRQFLKRIALGTECDTVDTYRSRAYRCNTHSEFCVGLKIGKGIVGVGNSHHHCTVGRQAGGHIFNLPTGGIATLIPRDIGRIGGDAAHTDIFHAGAVGDDVE